MAFDQPTRNRLARFVKDARDLITDEFTQKFAERFGIADDGTCAPLEKLTHLDEPGLATAALLRQRIDYLVNSHPEERAGRAAAVKRLAREQAFTVLNRLAALRMAEKRGLILESVGKGYQSKGYKLYAIVAGTGLGETYERYRRYLFCLCDELAVDLGALFDRHSPHGILFPREPALLSLLDLLNAADLEHLWAEDETIGWIYQYYNGGEVAEMRKAVNGGPPRNSRELAVRNQFFTPRYVVEFLTDNTLGRIWYEMTQGETSLRERCRYLVRRPIEIFLKAGEAAPEIPAASGNLSQEELLKQPVHIPHRPIKDPRELRMLDPACGSMHFGLYAFDLFEVIYDEAWELEEVGTAVPSRPSDMKSLHETYESKEAFFRDVPRLVIEHNIHGVDIDPRAAQIAALSLWLRAQKSWSQQGLAAAVRPRITRSHIVCAEPMPGDKALLADFVERAFPAAERPVFQHLLERIFDHMQLAGEAGSLLKIEEEIRTAIEEAKTLWEKSRTVSRELFSTEVINTTLRPGTQQELGGLDSAVSQLGAKADFWESAEDRIYQSLRGYSEQAETAGSVQRRLFANDAAQGFAFIDLCRKRYDVVVMNPPFGEASERILPLLQGFGSFSDNIVAPFAERFLARSTYIAMVLDRALLIRKTHENFRRLFLGKGANKLHGFANYGWGVLDANVEVAALVGADTNTDASYLFSKNGDSEGLKWLPTKGFAALPNLVISGDVPDFIANSFASNGSLGDLPSAARVGHQWKSERYLRLWWEGSNLGPYVYNGAPFSPYVFVTRNRILLDPASLEVQSEFSTVLRNSNYHYLPGIAYGKRGIHLDAHPLPAEQTFTVEGLACFPSSDSDRFVLLAYLNSIPVSALLSFYCGQHKHVGYLNCLPYSTQWHLQRGTEESLRSYIKSKLELLTSDESAPLFVTFTDNIVRGSGFKPSFFSFTETLKRLSEHFDTLHDTVGQEVCNWLKFPIGWNLVPSMKETVDTLPRHQSTDIFDESGFETATAYAGRFIGEVVGDVFGRWDIRYATGELPAPPTPDPFAPLPVCPPGMLQGDDGLPLSPEAGRKLRAQGQYPLDVAWGGILVDDPEHPLDLVSRVQAAQAVIWKDRAETIEHEACELLGVESLRDWFRRPAGFFADHLKRYSKSRRQAPIYWPLSTKSGTYTLWIYYHRLSDQTLHTAIADFVEPKIKAVEATLASARAANRTGELADAQEFLDELRDFKAELERITKLPWKPNLNDGVLITASPLWKLFRLPKWQKDLKTCWEELEAGDYDWAHLAYTLRPKQVEEKCKTDRSLAIAHGLEHLCQIEPPKPKAKRGRKAKAAQLETEFSDES